jgi:hypothetical protein
MSSAVSDAPSRRPGKAPAGNAVDLYYPFVVPHAAEDGCQSETAACELCGEKRVEDLENCLLVHSRIVVPHLQEDISPPMRQAEMPQAE